MGRQQVAGPPWYTTWDWPAAKRSVGALAKLEPQVLLPGHGRPLTTGAAAVLHALAQVARIPTVTTAITRLQWLGLALTSLGCLGHSQP